MKKAKGILLYSGGLDSLLAARVLLEQNIELIGIHFLPETLKESYRVIFIRIPVSVQMVMILAAGILLYHMRAYDVLPFIYFRF